MKIAIITRDTRGGVQPYVALGVGLQAAGHDVRMVATADFAPMFEQAGLTLSPVPGDSREEMTSVASMTEVSPIANMRRAAAMTGSRTKQWTKDTLAASEGAELLTGGIGGMLMGLSVAEKLGVPFVPTHLQPVDAPTSRYPGVLLPNVPAWMGGAGRIASHRLSNLALWKPFERPMMAARREVLGLSGRPTAALGQPVLYGFSRHVVDLPPEANPLGQVTGYWFADTPSDWSPPTDLSGFLAAGSPVVSIGFGSMAAADAASLTSVVRRAARAAGVRAVLLTGWGGLEGAASDDDVFVTESVPHDWLFSRVDATVHHGGAGTTGAALRAGRPTVVVPFTVDQPFWGGRAHALGAGPMPIPRKRLTADGLAAALRQAVGDSRMRARADEIGRLIRAEDGVARAVEAFGRVASRV
ncbi:MAG: hypothetical protein RI885_2026 [Actinomycetota bacterium]|jgi:UDP:flavonoid glycosyltransferase YjiC (YdhE family)